MKFGFDYTIDETDIEYFRTHEEYIKRFGNGVPVEMLPAYIKRMKFSRQ
ncbi:MAG: hypothetical protein Q4C20_00840 [Erysipelotrichaceae bacterium]|nr:hypothetical protein [Erysipelotrichaceae bacterium]